MRKISKDIAYMSLSFLYVNILGYIFHFYVSRKLAPSGYGEFMVLYSIFMIIGTLGGVFGAASMKSIVENKVHKSGVLRYLRGVGLKVGVALMVLFFLFSPFLNRYLNLGNIRDLFTVGASVPLVLLVFVERGFLQAEGKFGIYALSTSFELTLRLVAAVVFLWMGLYVFGAILSSVVALCAVLVFLVAVNRNFHSHSFEVPFKSLLKTVIYYSPASAVIYFDSIFIERSFSSAVAGEYAAVSILGKGLIWLSLTLFGVFFPKLVDQRGKAVLHRKTSFYALMMVVFIFITAEVFVLIFGKFLFLSLFGSQYLPAVKYMPFYVVAMFPLAVNTIFIGIFTSMGRYLGFIYLFLFAYLAGFALFEFGTVGSYIMYIGIFNTLFALVYFRLFYLREYSS